MTKALNQARVSTTGRDLDSPLAALCAAGAAVDRLFADKLSGSTNTGRPGLVAILDYARADDIVVGNAINRLGRSVGLPNSPHHRGRS